MRNLLKIKISLLFVFWAEIIFPQDFAPQVGFSGCKAIYKDSIVFIDWAVSCSVERGFQQIGTDTSKVTFGSDSLALGKPGGTMDVVSLGDGGTAVLTFTYPITDGEGPDFAVFENGFKLATNDTLAFLELAFVEVSDNGKDFYRFPAISQTPADEQIDGFGYLDARYIHNLAGKYIANYGTPFDLAELKDLYPGLNLNNIVAIKIIDVVGAVDSPFSSYDFYGNVINDPYPTPFASGGFDLDAVGVIHNITENNNDDFLIFPNPAADFINILNREEQYFTLRIFTIDGKLLYQINSDSKILKITLPEIQPEIFIVHIFSKNTCKVEKIISF